MGNAKAKAVYEADLPALFRRPQTDQALEGFIRAKYEQKRYILKDWQPPRVNVDDLPAASVASAPEQRRVASQSGVSPKGNATGPGRVQQPNSLKDSGGGGLLVDLFSSPEPNSQAQQQSSILGMESASSGGAGSLLTGSSLDDFGPIVSAPQASGPAGAIQQQQAGMRASVSMSDDLLGLGGALGGATESTPIPNAMTASTAAGAGGGIDGIDFAAHGRLLSDW